MRTARDEEMIWELLLENQPRFLSLILNVLIYVYMLYIHKNINFYFLQQ